MIEDPKFTIYGSQIQEWMEDIQKLKQERNKLQEKCDKLDDNTIELKKKARAFDKIKEAANFEKLNDYLLYDNERFIDRLCNIFDEMERDSDEYSRN